MDRLLFPACIHRDDYHKFPFDARGYMGAGVGQTREPKEMGGPSRGCGRSTTDTLHLVPDGRNIIRAKLMFDRFLSHGDSENFR